MREGESERGLVSVIIPAYNAEHFVAVAIDSVLAQTYPRVEVIVVNDGSTDGTASVLAGYGSSIRIVSKDNGGLSAARNSGIEVARGEWVAFLDADDRWLRDKLARQVEVFERFPQVGFCSTEAVLEDENGNILRRWECPGNDANLLGRIFERNATIPGSGSGVVVRKSCLEKVGGFDASLSSLEDVDMWLRLAAVTHYCCVPEALTVVFRRTESMSGNLEIMRKQALAVMRKNRPLLPPRERGAFWRSAYAGVLSDYAKWEYRSGKRQAALMHLLQALLMFPARRIRLIVGLLLSIVAGRSL